MKKQLNIKVQINSSFNIEDEVNLDHWNEANNEDRNYYVKNIVKDFLLDHIDDIIDELMDGSKIEF